MFQRCHVGTMAVAAVAAALLGGSAAGAQYSGGREDVHVYLLRGLMNVFSTGLDDLTEKLRSRGIRATVHNHLEFGSVANRAAIEYRSGKVKHIVLVGHSFGANAAMATAHALAQVDVPVDLVILFDPSFGASTMPNVRKLVNFYIPKGVGGPAVRRDNFRGRLRNIDVSNLPRVDHLHIDKDDRLQARAIRLIMSTVGAQKERSALRPAAHG